MLGPSQLALRLMPERFVFSVRPVILFPKFVGALPNPVFSGLFHG